MQYFILEVVLIAIAIAIVAVIMIVIVIGKRIFVTPTNMYFTTTL